MRLFYKLKRSVKSVQWFLLDNGQEGKMQLVFMLLHVYYSTPGSPGPLSSCHVNKHTQNVQFRLTRVCLCFNSLLWIVTSSINRCLSLEQNTESRNLKEHELTDYSNSVCSFRLETPAVPSVNTRWHQQALHYSASRLKWFRQTELWKLL